MRNIVASVACMLLPLSAAHATEAVDPSSLAFYSSLIDAIDKAQGTLDVYLSAGSWKAKVGDKNVLWENDEGTRVSVSFKYDGGVLQDQTKVSFKSPIHMWVLSGNADFSIGVKSVTFD